MAIAITKTRAPEELIVADTPDLFMRSVTTDWNYSRWKNLPADGNRYEVIDGVLYMTTAPSFFHQWIIQQLIRYVGLPAYDAGFMIFAFAPVGLMMPGCDPVQPDFVLVKQERAAIIHNRRIFGVPDLIVEVLSPGHPVLDEETKFRSYAEAELPEYVIVDPRTRTLRYYRLAVPGRYATPDVFGENDSVTFDCLPTITLKIAALFAGAPDTTL